MAKRMASFTATLNTSCSELPSSFVHSTAHSWRGQFRQRSLLIVRETNDKRCTLPDHRLEVNAALVFIHDDGSGNGKSLPGAFSYLFGGEEGVEDLCPDLEWNPRPGISNADFNPGWAPSGFYCDLAFSLIPFFSAVADRVGCVHDEVKDHLVELPRQARDCRQSTFEPGFNISDILPF